ncbi:23S rRNA (pseudouridine(1915)-N(3))-methyltransferase RlmH [Oceanibaculum pacificum]|uniref:Ribosomal RNA large subunit methyltransferase H n=1 Tax=Oceanibaculum pacificum TaxID=580166 RepID=A0A154W490_9PROT|nr:23S rRNA (pseudouridine(1915)-N(3))-methyltransferase RlmH [Oceanibaculum pacificum]KZD08372.1 23S rRNA (pseudouridine(1915)-N(3))-methyltransferase RlmH [Oceanibaculum pacificum]
MRITIAAVGRAKPGVLRDLYELYTGRLRWPVSLKEVEPKGRLSGPELAAKEAELLLAAVPAGARVIALDERGREFDSPGFAALIGGWRDEAVADIALLIGGADGHDDSVRRRADLLLAFGRATWPHMLVRGMLAEQLYRAQQILAGHPYHRE